MADDTRDPNEPVEHYPGPAVGPNPDGHMRQAELAHQREAAPDVAVEPAAVRTRRPRAKKSARQEG